MASARIVDNDDASRVEDSGMSAIRHVGILVVPGFQATAANHWFPWLCASTRSIGLNCIVADLPNPGDPRPDGWSAAISQAAERLDGDIITVAHSLGCLSLIGTIARDPDLASRIMGSVYVAGFLRPLPSIPQTRLFALNARERTSLAGMVWPTVSMRSDDDPVVDRSLSDELARTLGATTVVVRGAGHFRAREGLSELPSVMTAIEGFLRRPSGE